MGSTVVSVARALQALTATGVIVAVVVVGGAAVAAPRPNGEESKSAQEIYADMKKALRSVSSIAVRTQGTLLDTTTFTEDDTFGVDVTHSVLSSGPPVIETL